MTEAERIWGRRRRLWRRDDGPKELATTTEASTEEYDPKVSTTITEVSAEEAEEMTRLRERLRLRRRQRVYGPRKLTTPTVALAEEDDPGKSVTTTDASVRDEE